MCVWRGGGGGGAADISIAPHTSQTCTVGLRYVFHMVCLSFQDMYDSSRRLEGKPLRVMIEFLKHFIFSTELCTFGWLACDNVI